MIRMESLQDDAQTHVDGYDNGNGEVARSAAPDDKVARSAAIDPLRPLRGDKLAIVGFSETTRAQTPFDDPDVEVWVCNRLGLIFDGIKGHRWDRHMDPHPLDWSAINHKAEDWRTYKEWFEKNHGDGLIYLPRLDPETAEVPNGVAFPFDEIIEHVGREYFSSAIGWQLGLALLLNEKYGAPNHISLYGIDLRGVSEYEYQRPNAEWLIGIAQGRGIEIEIPKESALLNQDNRSPLYGREIYSGFMGTLEKSFEVRTKEIAAKMEELRDKNEQVLNELKTWDGARQELQSWYQRVQQFRRGGIL